MSVSARILLAHDDPAMAECIGHVLRRAGFAPEITHAASEAALRAALAQSPWDIVLCADTVFHADWTQPLATATRAAGDLPFVIIAEAFSEAEALRAAGAGVRDYVRLQHLERLAVVLQRELGDAARRREHQEVQARLQANAERWRSLRREAPVGILVCNRAGEVVEVNDQLLAAVGAASAEEFARKVNVLSDPCLVERGAAQHVRACIETGRATAVDLTLRRPLGERAAQTVDLRCYISPLMDARNTITGAVMLTEDVSEQRRAEEALRQSEVRYRGLIENAPLGIVSCDRDGNLLTVNDRVLDMFGTPSAEASLALNLLTFEPLVAVGTADALRECLATERVVSGEAHYTSQSHKTVDMRYYFSPMRGVDGAVQGAQIILEDITEQKRAERQLRASEATLAKAQEIAHCGHWEWDVRTGAVAWSDEVYRIYGVEPQAFAPDARRAMGYVHPDDAAAVGEAVAAAFESGEPYRVEHRIIRDDGGERWVQVEGEVHEEGAGRPVRVLGIVLDVTDRRRAVEELARRAAFQEMLVDLATQFVNLAAEAVDAGIQHALGRVREFTGDDSAFLFQTRLGESVGDLTHEAVAPGISTGDELFAAFDLRGLPATYATLSRGEIVHYADLRELRPDSRERELLVEYGGLRSLVALPVLEHGELRAILGFANESRPKVWSPEDLSLLRVLGEIIQNTLNRARADHALRESEAQLAKAQALAHIGHWDVDPLCGQVRLSDELLRILGLTPEEFDGSFAAAFARCHPDDRAAVMAALNVSPPHEVLQTLEVRIARPDGAERVLLVSGQGEFDDQNRVRLIRGTAQDITERTAAEAALRASEERYRMLADNAADLIWSLAPTGHFTYVSPSVTRLCGFTPDELEGEYFGVLLTPTSRAVAEGLFAEVLAGERDGALFDAALAHKTAAPVWCEVSAVALRDDAGTLLRVQGVARDITARKAAEDALRASEQMLSHAQRVAQVGAWNWDIRGEQWSGSDELFRIHGLPPDTAAADVASLMPYVHPEDQARLAAATRDTVERGAPFDVEYRIVRPDGEERVLRSIGELQRDAAGRPIRLFGAAQDITEAVRAARALRDSERNLSKAQELAHVGSWAWDLRTDELTRSPEVCRICGLDPQDRRSSIADELNLIHPNDRERVLQAGVDALLKRRPHEVTYRVLRPDGSIRHVVDRAEFEYDSGGVAIRLVGAMLDVTEHVEAQQTQARLEAQLRQSQKMEAIGTLAGGIAHDFNNVLTGIIGFAELAEAEAERSTSVHAYLAEVLAAGERARGLVAQILAFSRQTEGERKPTDLEPLTKEALRLVRAGLPSTVEIRANVSKDDVVVLADPTQMHQVLMNLCTNAGHAMPKGGLLEVLLDRVELDAHAYLAHEDFPPGPYVRMRVRDTGTGIEPHVLERIFEPYFTTKEIGAGTGMGLAVVHGIIKSMKGDIRVYSEVGRGTEVCIYLPAAPRHAGPRHVSPVSVPRGSEHVLLVDDEPQVRGVLERMLTSLGYRVTACADGNEALEWLEQAGDRVHIALTDKTMPRMTGLELAREIRQRWPAIPVVLCTGFQDPGTQADVRGTHIRRVLDKPIARTRLATVVREVLDEVGQPPAWA